MQRQIELLQAKGISTWLTLFPSKQQAMDSNRVLFEDAIHLTYGSGIKDMPRLCECRKENSNDHAMTYQL